MGGINAVYDKLNTEGLTMYYNATTELLIDTQAGSTGYEWIQSNDCKDILNVSHAIEQDEDNEQMMGHQNLRSSLSSQRKPVVAPSGSRRHNHGLSTQSVGMAFGMSRSLSTSSFLELSIQTERRIE